MHHALQCDKELTPHMIDKTILKNQHLIEFKAIETGFERFE